MNAKIVKKKNMIMGSFFGDAFSLGPHWIYDVDEIVKNFGNINEITAPLNNSHHKGKVKGDFTHYGDQTLLLLQTMRDFGGFDLSNFKISWKKYFLDYNGYYDGATKESIGNINRGNSDPVGSGSHDLSGASRIAPILYFYDNIDDILKKVEEQTSMTHNNPEVIESALFFAKITFGVLNGAAVKDTLLGIYESLAEGPFKQLIKSGVESVNNSTSDSLKSFGTSCAFNASLPGTVHLILKFSDNYLAAMNGNVMAGGDSAARAAIIGMVLGAALEIDEELFKGMNSYEKIKSLL